MKKKILILSLISLIYSCSKETKSITNTNTNTTSSESQTWVKLTAITSSLEKKSNYTVMMFEDSATNTSPLPAIIKQVVTDTNGVALFDLKNLITSNIDKKYYFEAFIMNGSNYIWKSISHPSRNIKKGTMVTTSIIVN